MNRWRRLAPPHREPARPWLCYPGSLTRRIVEHAAALRVELLQQRLRMPNEDEYRALHRPAHRLVVVREVLLHARGRPVVLAHSVAARADLFGAWRRLRTLGTRPLATALFADPVVRRLPFEYARLDPRHALWRRARHVLRADPPALWARRSVFLRHGRPLMVTEVFLPALLELAR